VYNKKKVQSFLTTKRIIFNYQLFNLLLYSKIVLASTKYIVLDTNLSRYVSLFHKCSSYSSHKISSTSKISSLQNNSIRMNTSVCIIKFAYIYLIISCLILRLIIQIYTVYTYISILFETHIQILFEETKCNHKYFSL